MLTKVVEDNGNDFYLDSKSLTLYKEVEKLAYLVNAVPGTDRRMEGFYTFYFKDVNSLIVVGRMFNIKDFVDTGYDISTIRKRPVSIRFTPTIFNNSLSLVINRITPWDKEFDHSKFVGKLDNAEELYERINKRLVEEFNLKFRLVSKYMTDSYSSIYGGIAGGYLLLIDSVLNSIKAYAHTPSVVMSELMECAVRSISFYSSYLEIKERMDIPLKYEVLNLVNNSSRSCSDERLRNICVDTMTALAGLGRPTHLYSHIVYKNVKMFEETISFAYEYPLIVKGSSKQIGSELLSRY